jgi:carbamoyltransferase
MIHIGVSCGFHDAGMAVVNDQGDILFAGHSERYTKKKHDKNLCAEIAKDAQHYFGDHEKKQLYYYERPWLKMIREIISGQRFRGLGSPLSSKKIIGEEFLDALSYKGKVKNMPHHKCHAAAGFQTSPFNEATVVVIDAIGEIDCATIWHAYYDKKGNAQYKRLWSSTYPNSIGLYYSAMTHRVGLRPLDEEYILMGMAAYGKPKYVEEIERKFGGNNEKLEFKLNAHVGIEKTFLSGADEFDIAASSQIYVEQLITNIMKRAQLIGKSGNLVYSGGVALNCSANRLLGDFFNDIWIMPNPGDCGNALGAAALGYGKKLNWKNAFLGTDITGIYPVQKMIEVLKEEKIAGIASGRAEFGPRALGTRSLLADPRGPEIKDKVNEIKRRQKFRPFAPMILEELVDDYFDMPKGWKTSPYMQVTAPCKHPKEFPAIIHKDGSSRVQTVPNDGSGIRRLLEAWYEETGCPILLNTSLNIRGEPMVNDRSDADRFEKLYNTRVIS